MPTVADLAARCEQIGGQLRRGRLTQQEVLDAATSLLLIVSMLDRLLRQEPPACNGADAAGVVADVARARETLHGVESVAQTAGEDELLQEVLRAQTSAAAAFHVLLARKGT